MPAILRGRGDNLDVKLVNVGRSPLLDCNMMEVNKENCPHYSLADYVIVPTARDSSTYCTSDEFPLPPPFSKYHSSRRKEMYWWGLTVMVVLVQFNKTAVSNVEL